MRGWPGKVGLCGFAGGGLWVVGAGDVLPRAEVASCYKWQQAAAKLLHSLKRAMRETPMLACDSSGCP